MSRFESAAPNHSWELVSGHRSFGIYHLWETGNLGLMTGERLARVRLKKVTTTLPAAEAAEIVELIESSERWVDAADFARQAIREKLERWKKEHPLGVPPGSRKGN